MKIRIICLLPLVFALTLLVSAPLAANPIFTINSGSLTLSRLIVGDLNSFEVRGLVALDVANPDPLGTMLLVDPLGGGLSDPRPPCAPGGLFQGNNVLIGINSGGTENIGVLLDFCNPQIDPGSLDLYALGVPLLPAVTTDPTLQALQGRQLQFDFALTNLRPVGTDYFATYTLTGVTATDVAAVPEFPAIGLLTTGILGLGWAKQRLMRRR
jgi:hypothetical protein